jgi:hypothetical protein
MNEKRKLILDFALECFVIVLYLLTIVAHFPMFMVSVILCFWLLYRKLFFPQRTQTKKQERELTTVEVIDWFSIGISAICIFGFVMVKGLLNNIAFIIPMWIMILAFSLLAFAKKLAALNTSKSASN